jgi:rhomboid family protein
MNGSRQYGPGEYRPQFGGFSFFPPVIKNIIIVTVVAYIVQQFALYSGFTIGDLELREWFVKNFYLWPFNNPNPMQFADFQIWQVVSYMFLHGGLWHIGLNMLMLWMFGMEVENTWGSRNFLIFYFVCGISAALANLFVAPLFSSPGATIGASGGVYGVLVAFAMLFPNRYVYVYFLVPVKAKYLITFFIMLEVYNGMGGGAGDGIAHLAHLGGAVVGAIWVLLDRKGMIDRAIGTIQTRSAKKFVQSQRKKSSAQEANFYEMPQSKPDKPNGGPSREYQTTIDAILDKIGKDGYSALTEDEKRMLLDASRRIQPDDE